MGDSSPFVPRVMGRYALYDAIASGGMATVHLGRLLGSAGFSRTVAIKSMHPQFASDPEFVSMFLDEARLVARISHPNVIPTLDVVASKGELLIVMEYVRGESLSTLIRAAIAQGSLMPPTMVAAILVGVLHGLHAAHEAKSERGEPLGIVHRDVSPQNILVGADGVPRLLDFGVAKAAGRLQTTRDGQLKGKVGYMAPEQISGEASRATDVYAASVVLWETLTGRRLFAGENDGQVLARVLAGCKVPPSAYAPGIPAALDLVTLRGLAADAAGRYATAREMAAALEEAVPLMTTSKIGAWVESVARDALAARSARIEAIESDSMLQAPPVSRRAAEDPTRDAVPEAPIGRGRRAPWLLGLAAVTVAALLARHRFGGALPAASAPAARAITLADLPPPATKVAEAAAEFAAGMQELHDDSWSLAQRHFERTVDLDPRIAIAHLRLAMTSLGDSLVKREEFAKAVALRAQLSPRDQALLEALEPVLQRSRDDTKEARVRLERASRDHPGDVEFLDWLGLLGVGDPASALVPSELALELDAKDGQAWETKGRCLTYLGRNEEARAAFERCAAIAVDTTDCLLHMGDLDAIEGRCDVYEADARRLFDRDHERVWPLASAMLARGRPTAAALEILDEAAALEPDPAKRASRKARSRSGLAILAGDLEGARESARQDLAAIGSSATTRANYRQQLRAVTELVDVLEETGKDGEARAVASDFVSRSEGWASIQEVDASLWLLRRTVGPGGLSPEEFARRQAAWVDERLTTSGIYPGLVWSFGYAASAMTADEARGALDAVTRFLPLTSYWDGGPAPDAYAGRAYLLAGRAEEAIVFLSRAVSNCNLLYRGALQTRAAFELGLADEATGNRDAACAAYALVLDRWGNAKPRSVTAEKARARAKALACSR